MVEIIGERDRIIPNLRITNAELETIKLYKNHFSKDH